MGITQIRAMYDDRGSLVDQVGPSNAVQVFFLLFLHFLSRDSFIIP
jgi:hypothetical protein